MMRLWWRRGRISGKRLLWYAFVVAFLIIVYRLIQENAGDIERQWTCEELHAKDRLIQLVSINFINAGNIIAES